MYERTAASAPSEIQPRPVRRKTRSEKAPSPIASSAAPYVSEAAKAACACAEEAG